MEGQTCHKEPLTISFCYRETEADEELLAASYLRAISFYAYPPERALAGKVCPLSIFDMIMKARLKALDWVWVKSEAPNNDPFAYYTSFLPLSKYSCD